MLDSWSYSYINKLVGGKLERQSRVSQKCCVNCLHNTFTPCQMPSSYSTFKAWCYTLYIFENTLFVPAVIMKPKVFSDREAFLLMYDMPLFALLQKRKKQNKTNNKHTLLTAYIHLQSHLGYLPLLFTSELYKIT